MEDDEGGGWLVHFYVRRAAFKLAAAAYVELYGELLFLAIGLKHPPSVFLSDSSVSSNLESRRA